MVHSKTELKKDLVCIHSKTVLFMRENGRQVSLVAMVYSRARMVHYTTENSAMMCVMAKAVL